VRYASGTRTRATLADGEELTIVCHNNPDPDRLASAFALGRIAMGTGIDEHHRGDRRCIRGGDHEPDRAGSVLISGTGRTSERDALPQAADYLGTLEGVETAIVFGIVEDGVQLSARPTDSRIHIGDVLDEAVSDVGSAGGHREMPGGEVPLGIFADYTTDDTRLFAIVDQVMTARLVAELNLTTETGARTDPDGEDE